MPFGWSPAAVQTDVPVVQEVAPVRHGWPDKEQLLPAVHETQVPAVQTLFVPHTVPSASGCPVSVQVSTPSEQVV